MLALSLQAFTSLFCFLYWKLGRITPIYMVVVRFPWDDAWQIVRNQELVTILSILSRGKRLIDKYLVSLRYITWSASVIFFGTQFLISLLSPALWEQRGTDYRFLSKCVCYIWWVTLAVIKQTTEWGVGKWMKWVQSHTWEKSIMKAEPRFACHTGERKTQVQDLKQEIMS